MKKILIVLPDHFSVRNFLYSPFIKQNFKEKNIEVVFVLNDPGAHKNIINGNNLILDDIESKKTCLLAKLENKILLWLNETLNYRFSTINELRHIRLKEAIPKKFIISGHDIFPWYIKYPLTKSIFLYKTLLILYFSRIFIDKNCKHIIEKHKPDLLISTNPQDITARSFYNYAKKYEIKTACYVNSWDYLTSDGPVLRSIDSYFLWNKQMDFELKNIQKIKNQTDIVGPLHFDYSFTGEFVWAKDKINKFLDLPPEAHYAVYGVCGERIGKHEPEIAEYLAKKLNEYGIYLIIRGHPEDPSIPERFKSVLKNENVRICQGSLFNKTQIIDDRAILFSLLANTKAVICGPTTLTLDAIRFDKPIINIAFDGSLNLPPEASIAARYTIDHFAPLLKYNGIYYTTSFEELDKNIKKAIEFPGELAEGRNNIKRDYLEPLDGKASERLFNLIVDKLYGKKSD